ncbi:hypothetical protein Poli38472_007563 [Pythium oligandrum]|uniref:Uncharacterized protein n=1 Tax=Pythium oligandrum TaxID=41045 RepID=A0A8K1FM61_PYTOL|nr:hypothetical protein Poli38472_007563 [Pythium oligandrum]|eukprot:TMW67891.1 hypothetical protein Poli38472_007563 [Pythium oligandrum]
MIESDEETVAAVVAFVDGFYEHEADEKIAEATVNDEVCVSTSTNKANDGGTTQKKHRKPTPAKVLSHNRSRERQRRELLSLREEETALRTRVLEMTMTRAHTAPHKHVGERNDRQMLVSMWKEVASRQKKKRRAAETENTSLRARVMEQQRVIRSLQRLLASQVKENPLASSRLYSPAWRVVCADEDPQRRMQLFNQLIAQLQQIYKTTDTWIDARPSLATDEASPYSDSRLVSVSPSVLAVETVSIRHLPFPFKRTGQAHWNQGVKRLCGALDFFQEEFTVHEAEALSSARAIAYEDDASGSDGIRLRQYAVSQLIVENQRVAIVTASCSDSVHIRRQLLPDMMLDEQYWKVFIPSPSNPDDASLMVSFGRILFDLDAGWASAQQLIPALFTYFTTNVHQYSNMSAEMSEDWILTDTRDGAFPGCAIERLFELHPVNLSLKFYWKELASRQLKKRSAAEAENKSLRERVMEQRRVIKSLQRLLASQVREDPLASARLYSPAWIAICADEDPQRRMQLFGQLTSRLRQVYVATDSWMKTSQRLAKGTNHYSDSRVITLSSSLIAVETVSIHRFPFPFRTTGNAYWNLGVKRLCGTLDFFQEHAMVEGTQTVLSGKAIAYENHANCSDGIQFRTHVASQRIDEDQRIAIVNASCSESMHVKYQHLPELTLDNQLWSVFCPSESTPDDACVMMSFGRVFFDFEAGWANAHHVVPVLFKYFATTIHQYADMSADMIEDWILADKTNRQN